MTTYEDQLEARRTTSVGAKMMIFALAIFAVLGAFWTIVWFIRSYVEQPRINAAIPMALAARDSRPVAPPPAADPAAPPAATDTSAAPTPAQATVAAPPIVARVPQPAANPVAAPSAPPVTAQATPAPAPAPTAADPTPPGPISDRWLPPPSQEPAAAPVQAFAPVRMPASTPPAATTEQPPEAQSDDAANNEVVAAMEPAITGPVPTPRRKPPVGASAKLREPPVPRPRPDGSAPQSVWTAVPVQDDRFPTTPAQQ